MLQFKKYKKFYNNELVLSIEDVLLKHGLYWIKGANGCGKSTLLKSIAGLIPFEGEITLCGLSNDRINNKTYRRMVNYGEAEPEYPKFFKGTDLISIYKTTKGTTSEQVNYLLERLGVTKFKSKEIGTYSSGMVKKLSLALAFIGNPELILLDEPLITLDYHTNSIVKELIQEYLEKGTSIILVSHQEFTEELSLPVNMLTLYDSQLNTSL